MTRRFTSSPLEPYDRGCEFGQALRTEILSTVDGYRRLFRERGATEERIDELGTAALIRTADWAQELADELWGIAAGTGLAVSTVAAVNARTEILAALGPPGGRGECSTVVADGVAVQNWDWYATMAGNWLEWTIPFPDGRRVTTLTEYGMLGKIGINDRGVGTLFNILHHRRDGDGMGVPVHMVARRILDTADSVEDGLAVARSVRYSASTSISIVDGAGAAMVEVWPGGVDLVEPDKFGRLLRTNHFLTARAAPEDDWAAYGEDTMRRHEELRRRLDGPTPVTLEAAFDALCDGTSGLCCHPGPTEPHATLATVALDLPGRTLRVSDGLPCQAQEFRTEPLVSP
jgi:isopenicillin-N N-acyltransferase like protein